MRRTIEFFFCLSVRLSGEFAWDFVDDSIGLSMEENNVSDEQDVKAEFLGSGGGDHRRGRAGGLYGSPATAGSGRTGGQYGADCTGFLVFSVR
jgi:hypothetical protein